MRQIIEDVIVGGCKLTVSMDKDGRLWFETQNSKGLNTHVLNADKSAALVNALVMAVVPVRLGAGGEGS